MLYFHNALNKIPVVFAILVVICLICVIHVKLESIYIPKNLFDSTCFISIKYLGVVTQKNLTWNEHIESLIAKVNQRIGLLNRVKHLLPLDARVALYNALIAGLPCARSARGTEPHTHGIWGAFHLRKKNRKFRW